MDKTVRARTNEALLTARQGTHYASWRAHAALLGLIGGYVGLSAAQSTPDANIGLGLGLLALGVAGAPWSMPPFMSERMTPRLWAVRCCCHSGGDLQPRGSCHDLGMEKRPQDASAITASPQFDPVPRPRRPRCRRFTLPTSETNDRPERGCIVGRRAVHLSLPDRPAQVA